MLLIEILPIGYNVFKLFCLALCTDHMSSPIKTACNMKHLVIDLENMEVLLNIIYISLSNFIGF